jgi:hypothetical protein
MAASRDGYVPRSATEALHRHWAGSELRIERTGHAMLLVRGIGALARTVVDAFERAHGPLDDPLAQSR